MVEAHGLGLHCNHKSRPKSDHWRVLDFGSVIVHLMTEEARSFYSLERLNEHAHPIAWEASRNGVKKKAKKAVKK